MFAVIIVVLGACGNSIATESNDYEVGAQVAYEPEQNAQQSQATEEPEEIVADAVLSHEIVYTNARTWVNSIGTVWVQSIFEVKNTGSVPLFLGTGAYDLERTDGTLVASRSMVSVFPNVIFPGESAFYYEETMLDVEPGIDLVILPRPDVREARVEGTRLTITDFSLSEGLHGRGIRMMGRVENTTDEAQSFVYVAAALFDDTDSPIGLIFTILMENLEPGDRIGFEQGSLSLPDDITLDSVARYEVFAYISEFQF